MGNVLTEDFKSIAESDLPFEEFRNRSFVITGATGLVGSLLVRALMYCDRVHDLGLKVYAVVRNVEKAKAIFGEEAAPEYIVADLAKDEIAGSFDCDHDLCYHHRCRRDGLFHVQRTTGTAACTCSRNIEQHGKRFC